MNVAYILHSTNPYDGAWKAFLQMLEGLIDKGIKPILILPDKNGVYTFLQEKGIEVFVCPFRPSAFPYTRTLKEKILFLPRLLARIIINSIAIRNIYNYLREKSVSLIHTNVSILGVGYAVSRRLGIPHIYHIREYANKLGIRHYPSVGVFHKHLTANESYSICITKDIQRHYFSEKHPNSTVIYDSISVKKTKEIKGKDVPDSKFFLFAGRIEPVKGLDFIIDAYIRYQSTSMTPLPLYVAGEARASQYLEKLKEKLQCHHLNECVHFLGQRDDLNVLMKKAECIIIASTFEGFGLCMPEAMLNRCLVCARNNSGTKEQLDNGLRLMHKEIALRFETKEELADLLIQIEHQEKDYEEMKEAAYETVRALYSPEAHVRSVYEWYKQVTKKQ